MRPDAGHYFATYFHDEVHLHYEHLHCAGASFCNASGCLHKTFKLSAGRYHLAKTGLWLAQRLKVGIRLPALAESLDCAIWIDAGLDCSRPVLSKAFRPSTALRPHAGPRDLAKCSISRSSGARRRHAEDSMA